MDHLCNCVSFVTFTFNLVNNNLLSSWDLFGYISELAEERLAKKRKLLQCGLNVRDCTRPLTSSKCSVKRFKEHFIKVAEFLCTVFSSVSFSAS